MPDKDDRLTDIPSITPAKDEVASYHRNRQSSRQSGRQSTGRRDSDSVKAGAPTTKKGSPLFSFMLMALLFAVGAWAYVLQQQTVALEQRASDAELRLAELEGRLSNTDESVSQSSVAMQVKLKDLDTEVRKLWDNVWKRSKEQLAAHESKLTKLEGSVSSQGKQLSKIGASQGTMQKHVKEVQGLSIQLSSFQTQTDSQERLLADLRKKLVRLDNLVSLLDSRLAETEGWNESNLAHRKQVTSRLAAIEKEINTLKVALNPY